jgi:hypothetical protein
LLPFLSFPRHSVALLREILVRVSGFTRNQVDSRVRVSLFRGAAAPSCNSCEPQIVYGPQRPFNLDVFPAELATSPSSFQVSHALSCPHSSWEGEKAVAVKQSVAPTRPLLSMNICGNRGDSRRAATEPQSASAVEEVEQQQQVTRRHGFAPHRLRYQLVG